MTTAPLHPDLPHTARFWPAWVQGEVAERIAIMREGNRVPQDAPTPPEIQAFALTLAAELMEGKQ